MATVTTLTPLQRKALREAAAIAELKRNGIQIRTERIRTMRQLGLDNAPESYSGPPLAPLPAKGSDFHSRPDAKPMRREDIANVQFLNLETAKEILEAVGKSAPKLAAKALQHVEENYRTLLTEGERFALSAMAARKFMREMQPA